MVLARTPSPRRGSCLFAAALLAACAPKAPPRTAAEQAALEAQERAEHQQAWLEQHRGELAALGERAGALQARVDALLSATASWRVGGDALEGARAGCPGLQAELETYGHAVAEAQAAFGGAQLPGLPEGWGGPGLAGPPRAVGARCAELPELLRRWQEADRIERESAAIRGGMRGNAARAAAAVGAADALLRTIVGNPTFVAYLDALDRWQETANAALRAARRPDASPEEVASAARAEAAAEGRYQAQHGVITLKISGRSGQLLEALDAAVGALRKLSTAERTSLLLLFPPEVTPASPVLIQLLQDRI